VGYCVEEFEVDLILEHLLGLEPVDSNSLGWLVGSEELGFRMVMRYEEAFDCLGQEWPVGTEDELVQPCLQS
jgi:hypothetical protein